MAVLGPVFAVLGGALFLVAEDAVDEEDDQEEEVEQRPDVVAPTGRQAPSEGGHQLEDVVEMPRHSPAAGQEQLGRFISQLIAHCQTARRSAPQRAFPARLSVQLLLVINAVIHSDGPQS